jgi:hypothetical protein
MKKSFNLPLFISFFVPGLEISQSDDDIFGANRLKKVFPDDRVAATIIEKEFNFDKGRSDDNIPVVTATRNININFLALRERAGILYFDFYNSFTTITSFKQVEKVKGMFGMKKYYKQMTVKKESWPKLLDMLDAAFNFSQKRVLLKKI